MENPKIKSMIWGYPPFLKTSIWVFRWLGPQSGNHQEASLRPCRKIELFYVRIHVYICMYMYIIVYMYIYSIVMYSLLCIYIYILCIYIYSIHYIYEIACSAFENEEFRHYQVTITWCLHPHVEWPKTRGSLGWAAERRAESLTCSHLSHGHGDIPLWACVPIKDPLGYSLKI